jgi:branched-chain amino acid transport system permease protein
LEDVAIECRNLVKQFGSTRIINDVSLGLQSAKLTALVGPNGAGKTTLFHVMTGFLEADHGEIWYKQHRIDHLRPHARARLGIGRLFQDVRLFENLSVLENVLVGFRNQIGENPIWAVLRPSIVFEEQKANSDLATSWLVEVGLEDSLTKRAGDLSYGQRKLLAIARLLALRADVLLLDEPTAGVNATMIASFTVLLRRLVARGITIALIEHNVDFVKNISDYIYVMDSGVIVDSGSAGQVLERPVLRRSYVAL